MPTRNTSQVASTLALSIFSLTVIGYASQAQAQWVVFENQTSSRMVITTPDSGDPIGVATDTQEKDYAWGDVNNDGWIDLVVVRKQPFTTAGKRRNLLLLNENGVLTDRTAQYAIASDVGGDQGFYTATNDRDVALADLNGDGWLDIVTSTTISDGDPKHIGHPRIYMNLGEVAGVWQGFRHENDRIPRMYSTGQLGSGTGQNIVPNSTIVNPRFCSVTVGDVTGDGYPDIYFGDYDGSGVGSNTQPNGFDYNNRLLVNAGAANPGFFADQSAARMGSLTGSMLNAAFGAASVIADMNGDDIMDVVKQTGLNAPQHVAVTYNNPGDEGNFNQYNIVNSLAPYFVSVGDLNNDGRLDMVVSDDNADRYYINTGNNAQGVAQFSNFQFSFSYTTPGNGDGGFGSNSVIADLDGDGWKDVLIADVDVDDPTTSCGAPGCTTRRMQIYHNLGNAPNVTLIEERIGTESAGTVASIPTNLLVGVHDVAVFDINNDGALDLVIGRKTGTQVWINKPQVNFTYPSGQPLGAGSVPSGDVSFVVRIIATANAAIDAASATLHVSRNGGPFLPNSLTSQGGGNYGALIPNVECDEEVRYYASASILNGANFRDPADAPISSYMFSAVDSVTAIVDDGFEGSGPPPGWAVADTSVTFGTWVAAYPVATLQGGALASPGVDGSPAGTGRCFITGNAVAGGTAPNYDLDGGPTRLTSSVIDASGPGQMRITYDRWFFCDDAAIPADADFLVTEVSNNGGASWVQVHSTGGTGGQWQRVSFTIADFVTPTNNVRVRFTASDSPNNSVTNAALDNFKVEVLACDEEPPPPPCVGDIAPAGPPMGDGIVNVDDLLLLLGAWGPGSGPADLNSDKQVNVDDLLTLLGAWGGCK